VREALPEDGATRESLFVERESSPALPLLRRAMRNYDDADLAEELLVRAQAVDGECLHVYFALYKFYFYRKQFDAAEKIVRKSLTIAASWAGFRNLLINSLR
jgi:hypothetical protein